MKTFAEVIKNIRLSKDMSQEEFAELLGTSKQVISRYETSQRIPKLSVAQMYSEKLGISLSELMGESNIVSVDDLIFSYDNIFPLKTKKIPLLGKIACGQPIYADELHGEYISTSEDIKADFCLTCNGDSMINARIYDGDIVFIRRQESVDNGEIAAVIIDDEATLKRVYYYPNKNLLILKAENPSYGDLVYSNDELDTIHILGKAIAFQSVVR